MSKVIISFLSVLLIFFPFSGTLQSAYQSLTFPGADVVTADIIEAVESNNIAIIEDMFSEIKKDNIGQLSDKMQNFIELIDGSIINADFYVSAGESSESGMGYAEKTCGWFIKVETTKDIYYILVGWTIIDTLNPKNVGLNTLALMDSKGYNETFEYLIIIEQ